MIDPGVFVEIRFPRKHSDGSASYTVSGLCFGIARHIDGLFGTARAVSTGRNRDIRSVTEVSRPFPMTPQDSRFSWLLQGDFLCRTVR